MKPTYGLGHAWNMAHGQTEYRKQRRRAMQDWQKGIELDRLRKFAAPFKAAHKPLVFGAFGLTKERDIAEYLAKNQAIWTGTGPDAVALFKPVKLASEQTDFAGRSFEIPPGAVVVKSFVASSQEAGEKILRALVERAKAAVWIEVFEEDKPSREAVEARGFTYVTTKVSAGSELKSIYVYGAPVPLPEFEPAEQATLLVLQRDFLSAKTHSAIKAEVAKFESQFAQHYSDYNKRKSWTAFALHGYSDDPAFIIKPAEMSKSWKEENAAWLAAQVRWSKAAANFPATVGAVKGLGLKLDRVRFMRLRAKDGELSRHADITDREAGVQDGRVTRLHVPITTSDAVTMIGWSARGERMEVKFPERALCYLDQRKPHSVLNKDPALNRVHLVIDCFADGKLRKLIAAAMPKEKTARPFAA
jgi:hypothetical protein